MRNKGEVDMAEVACELFWTAGMGQRFFKMSCCLELQLRIVQPLRRTEARFYNIWGNTNTLSVKAKYNGRKPKLVLTTSMAAPKEM